MLITFWIIEFLDGERFIQLSWTMKRTELGRHGRLASMLIRVSADEAAESAEN